MDKDEKSISILVFWCRWEQLRVHAYCTLEAATREAGTTKPRVLQPPVLQDACGRYQRYMVLLVLLALLSSAAVSAAAAATVGPDFVERLPTETDCGGPWIYASACREATML